MVTGTPPTDETAPQPSAFHRELSAAHDGVVLRLLSAHPEDRPESAAEAVRELSSVPWPILLDRVVVRKPAPERPSGRLHDDHGRYQRTEAGFVCTRTGRTVERALLTADGVSRARAFAQCTHRSIQPVLTASLDDAALWLELPAGRPLSRPLEPAESRMLHEGLDRLHARGFVHGRVDHVHLWATAEGVILRYAAELPALGNPAEDLRALAALTAGSG